MLAIGFNGGISLAKTSLSWDALIPLVLALATTIIIPIYTFFVMRKRLNVYDSAAIAATYGSVSQVTFITATNFLDILHIPYGGQMVAALALMEAPAIIVGLLFVKKYSTKKLKEKTSSGSIWHEALFNSATYLILGSLLIGFLSGDHGETMLAPFTSAIFKGILCFFMLDMGLLAAQKLEDLKKAGLFLVISALGFSIVNAALAIILSKVFGLSVGNSFLLTALCASASYIAVPAAMRLSIPKSNPSIYLTMALGITFTFNVIFGLPIYLNIIKYVLS